jgi:PhnB protein
MDVAGGRPEGLRTVTPYLHPRSANRLIEFLQAAFGAEETFRHEMPERGVAHAKVRIGDAIIEMGDAHGPWQPMPTAFYVYVPDVEALYARALRAGGRSLQPPTDQPYGDRTAHVADPFGNVWYLATHGGGRR